MPNADELFARHHRDIYRYLVHMTGRAEDAEDLAQEVFLRVVRNLPNGGPVGHERGWVFSIARNLLLDRHRSNGIRNTTVAPRELAQRGTQGLAFDLNQSLARLPEEDREVFLLKEVGGFTYQEIADTCGCTVEAVRARLYRTRLVLRTMMTPEAAR